MPSTPEERLGHRCLSTDCGHPESDHLATPELAAPAEVVVFCAGCRRHEVHRLRGLWRSFGRSSPSGSRRRFSRPS